MALQGDVSDFSLIDIIQLLDLSKDWHGLDARAARRSTDGWLYFATAALGAKLDTLPPLERRTFLPLSGPFKSSDVALDAPTMRNKCS